jgi:hypothetical protein
MADSPEVEAMVEGLRESADRLEQYVHRWREIAEILHGARLTRGTAAEAAQLVTRVDCQIQGAEMHFEYAKTAIEQLAELFG